MPELTLPYTHTPGKLGEFLTKLQGVGIPGKLDTSFPKSIGFGSSHARQFPAILKFVGLLDGSGKPTDAYRRGLRGGRSGRPAVAEAIRAGYEPLFRVYADANAASDSDLVVFVKSNTSLDEAAASLVVRTFKTLCTFGDFDSQDAKERTDEDRGELGRRQPAGTLSAKPVVVNVNISLSVDATSDAAVYDAFFAAMAKHLTGLGNVEV